VSSSTGLQTDVAQPPLSKQGGGSYQPSYIAVRGIDMRPFSHRRSISLPLFKILDPPLAECALCLIISNINRVRKRFYNRHIIVSIVK